MRNVFSPSALGLAHEYISTEQNGLHSYGGSQSAHPYATMRACGCGVIAGLDVILYLSRHSGGTCPFAAGEDGQSVPLSVYNSFASRLRRGFLPLIPGRGINGLMLTGGLELFFLRWRLNLLTISEAEARSMGVNTKLLRLAVIVCATLATAASVSISGMIGWVGLVIPHICRLLIGQNTRLLLPCSMLLGASFLMLVDDLARCLTTGEIPLGILTALVGAPLFLYLIVKGGARDAA